MKASRPTGGLVAAAALAAIAASASAEPARFPLESQSGPAAARIAVDPSGIAAALYPASKGRVRLLVGASGRATETVPVPRGAVVEGLALGPAAQPFVAVRARLRCSPLYVLTRTADGVWAKEPVGIQAVSATVATDPSGLPGLLAARCDGSLSYHTRTAPPAWPGETTGARASRVGRLSLAMGPGGIAVGGMSGPEAIIQARGPAGWATLPFPLGSLSTGETAGTMLVGFDAAQRPVALTTRGPRKRSPFDSGLGSSYQRAAYRFETGAWGRIPTVADPVSLASGGSAFALLDRDGNLTIETALGTTRVAGRPVRLSLGPGGLLAQIQRAGGAYELQVGS